MAQYPPTLSRRPSIKGHAQLDYWYYHSYNTQELELLETQCRTSTLTHPPTHLTQYLKHLEGVLATNLHPILHSWLTEVPLLDGKEVKELLRHHGDLLQEYREMTFDSIKIDDLTLKVLEQCVAKDSFGSYQFINNDLSDSNLLNLIELIHVNPKLLKLTFNYNRNRVVRLLEIGSFKNIVFLSLKMNFITDTDLRFFKQNLIGSKTKLRFLDLYGNRITAEGVTEIVKILEMTEMEYVGLGRNEFRGLRDLAPLLSLLQMVQLSSEEKEEYTRLIQEKKAFEDTTNRKRKADKKQLEAKVPADVLEIDYRLYRVKSPNFCLLNLMDNGFQEEFKQLQALFKNISLRTKVVLSLNQYSEAVKQQMSASFPSITL